MHGPPPNGVSPKRRRRTNPLSHLQLYRRCPHRLNATHIPPKNSPPLPPHPHILTHPLHTPQHQRHHRPLTLSRPIKRRRHATTTIYPRTNHHTHLIHKTRTHKRPIKVPTTRACQPLHTKHPAQHLQRRRQIYPLTPHSYPRYTLTLQRLMILPRACLTRHDHQRLAITPVRCPRQPPMRVQRHDIPLRLHCLMPPAPAYRRDIMRHKRLLRGIMHLHRHTTHNLRWASQLRQSVIIGIRRIQLFRHLAVYSPINRLHHVYYYVWSHIHSPL